MESTVSLIGRAGGGEPRGEQHLVSWTCTSASDVEFYMHVTIEAGMAYARSFDTAANACHTRPFNTVDPS
jgi:hypothetical protein